MTATTAAEKTCGNVSFWQPRGGLKTWPETYRTTIGIGYIFLTPKTPLGGGVGGIWQSGPVGPVGRGATMAGDNELAAVPTIGATAISDRTASSDLRLIQQAIRNRWDIPEHVLAQLPGAMAMIALSEEHDDRARINAAKVLVSMNGQNSASESKTVNVTISHPGADLLD